MLGLHPWFPALELLKPSEVPEWYGREECLLLFIKKALFHGTWVYTNEVTLGGLLNGGSQQKDQAIIRSLKFSIPTPIFW